MKYFQKNDFYPNYFHPYYFIRKGLADKIRQQSSSMKGRLLDFGCGSKPYRQLFTIDEYIGIDFENEGHTHDDENIDKYYDGKTIPFEDASFDSVLSTEVFEHVFNLDEVLSELNRVLKMNGKMLITCPFVWIEHEVPYDYARYTKFALEHIFKKHHFKTVSFEKSGNFVTTITQLYILYFFQNIYWKRCHRYFLLRNLFKFFFVFVPNVCGVAAYKILPKDYGMYLNNVFVVEKINDEIRVS
jgi:SAM-dependent methyltransferase